MPCAPTELATLVAHEFRTPLSVILASADALDRHDDTSTAPQRRKRVANIRAQVQQMVRLLDDVLSFGRDAAPGVRCRRHPVDVEALCRDILAEIDTATQHTHALVFVARGPARRAQVDPGLLRRIVGNLLSNAVKYSPVGSEVGLEIECDAQALTLRVRDHGIGIDPQERARMFEPFQRGSNVGPRVGTGLGLAITQQAVALHGGTIAVESAPGIGSLFEVTLPVERLGEE